MKFVISVNFCNLLCNAVTNIGMVVFFFHSVEQNRIFANILYTAKGKWQKAFHIFEWLIFAIDLYKINKMISMKT